MSKTIVPEHYTFLYCICRQSKITTRNFLIQSIMEDVKPHNDELFHLFLNLGAIPKNRTPGKVTHI